MFKPVKTNINFPEMEKDILKYWYSHGIDKKYREKNNSSNKRFSFLDGPITANNPMGVHHAWGRTYKDLWQRFHNMLGKKQRFQNGFDCQGLWVEVEVEKELGFKSKKDIESYGIANFVNKCKERVKKYSAIQTEQSRRLGYFMDWDNSYFTMSDENNYAIWNFLKVCWERGWIYKGHESIPWCPRCETAISQHEMLTEDYKELVHESVYLKLPLVENADEFLLIWTTTPWTIPANIAVAVDVKMEYALVNGCWTAKDAVDRVFGKEIKITQTCLGKDLVGKKYRGPFDYLPAVAKVASDPKFHTVIPTDSQILPISASEGTGLVHTAVSAGAEDFQLGKKLGLPMIMVIADNADYLDGFGEFSGKNAKKHPEIIIDYLKNEFWTLKTELYKHRYPACWRCKTELVWKVADEWYIAMDQPSREATAGEVKKLTLRQSMVEVTKKITWLPSFGLDRELDWLKNMHDWLISKKNRYWGLALPIYECLKCGYFEIIGSKEELKKRSVSGFDKFAGNSPHRPWIDEVKIKCSKCGQLTSRILDVGNPWLDAGIVSISTLSENWFPADFITESFPGQFKNWFYSLIVMGTVLKKINPFKTVLGYASLLAEDGRPMHKSWGNAIEFNTGADKIGVDVMRWMFATQNPYENILFGYKKADEIRRKFHLKLWNIYNFLVSNSIADGWKPTEKQKAKGKKQKNNSKSKNILDQWILAKLDILIQDVTKLMEKYDAFTASNKLEEFVDDLSVWYVRRIRDRVGPTADKSSDKETAYKTLHTVLTITCRLLAPFVPFISEEIYRNLTGEESVHLASFPEMPLDFKPENKLLENMELVRKICELGHAKRKEAGMKVRQPLQKVRIKNLEFRIDDKLIKLIKDELNIKEVEVIGGKGELTVELDTKLTPPLITEGEARELVRQIQIKRKELGCTMTDKVQVKMPRWPKEYERHIMKKTLAATLVQSDNLEVIKA